MTLTCIRSRSFLHFDLYLAYLTIDFRSDSFIIAGLTNGYKKVRNDVYVTVTFSCVTGAVKNVACYISSIFVNNRARKSMLVSMGRFLRARSPMVVLAFQSDE